jgi:hypothetical protein
MLTERFFLGRSRRCCSTSGLRVPTASESPASSTSARSLLLPTSPSRTWSSRFVILSPFFSLNLLVPLSSLPYLPCLYASLKANPALLPSFRLGWRNVQGIYLSLLRSCKQTSIHTLPSINLMKNSASEIYVHDHAAAYQHAFGYIRQLAVHLRNSMRVKTKVRLLVSVTPTLPWGRRADDVSDPAGSRQDSYKAVYNWQFVHCIDFWSLVLSTACSRETQLSRGGVESELQPLIYPLVQVTLGVIRYASFHTHFLSVLPSPFPDLEEYRESLD